MPFTLKKQLVTDWENVTQEPRRLVKLPRELTAAAVMEQYMGTKKERSATAQQIARAQELMDGVRIYFDKVIDLISGTDALRLWEESAGASLGFWLLLPGIILRSILCVRGPYIPYRREVHRRRRFQHRPCWEFSQEIGMTAAKRAAVLLLLLFGHGCCLFLCCSPQCIA